MSKSIVKTATGWLEYLEKQRIVMNIRRIDEGEVIMGTLLEQENLMYIRSINLVEIVPISNMADFIKLCEQNDSYFT
jgi:hypothetical protein